MPRIFQNVAAPLHHLNQSFTNTGHLKRDGPSPSSPDEITPADEPMQELPHSPPARGIVGSGFEQEPTGENRKDRVEGSRAGPEGPAP